MAGCGLWAAELGGGGGGGGHSGLLEAALELLGRGPFASRVRSQMGRCAAPAPAPAALAVLLMMSGALAADLECDE
eukprot:SAG31_NODE_95_length_25901_cov_24.763700_9_plen_76_part_00